MVLKYFLRQIGELPVIGGIRKQDNRDPCALIIIAISILGSTQLCLGLFYLFVHHIPQRIFEFSLCFAGDPVELVIPSFQE